MVGFSLGIYGFLGFCDVSNCGLSRRIQHCTEGVLLCTINVIIPSIVQTTTYTNQSLFDETNEKIEYTRSFRCDAEKNITGFESFTEDNSISVALLVDFLQVQAFQFKNATSGAFDNGKSADAQD